MPRISIAVEGIPQLQSFFENAADELLTKVNRAKSTALTVGYNTARALVPVKTGRLKNSIRKTDDELSANTDYASYVEYGAGGRTPKPYMTPAAEEIAVTFFREVARI